MKRKTWRWKKIDRLQLQNRELQNRKFEKIEVEKQSKQKT